MSERLILCEGYHDRAFWAGLLTRLGCESFEGRPVAQRVDLEGRRLDGGAFGFCTPSGGSSEFDPARVWISFGLLPERAWNKAPSPWDPW